MVQEVEWCCKLYHVYVPEKKSRRHTRTAPWKRMVVDVAGALLCTPRGNRFLPVATGLPPGVVAVLQQRGRETPATWRSVSEVENRLRGGGRCCDGRIAERV